MRCPNCGKEIQANALVCPYCLKQFVDSSASVEAIPTAVKDDDNTDALKNDGKILINGKEVRQNVIMPAKSEENVIDNVKEESTFSLNQDLNRDDGIAESVSDEEDSNRVSISKSQWFFIIVIVVGIIIIAGIILWYSLRDNTRNSDTPSTSTTTTTENTTSNQTLNEGVNSTYNYPLRIGDVGIAALYDEKTEKYSNVDVVGESFITGNEAAALARSQNLESIDGFEWKGLVYEVRLNDLSYLNGASISPLLDAKLYKWSGREFIIYNNNHYFADLVSIYNGGEITNSERAQITVVYQVPIGEDEYSICLGDTTATMSCFSEFVS